MTKLNYVAVLVAAAAAFVSAFVYYMLLGDLYAQVSPAARQAATEGPQAWEIFVELSRNLVVTVVVAWLAARTAVSNWIGAVRLALALWIGFPLVLWVGAIVHENTPVQLAAIHAGDALIKLLVIALIVGLWQRTATRPAMPTKG